MTALISGLHYDSQLTRKTILIGAAASLICAPSVVRAASLMPICSVIAPANRIYVGFVDRLRLHCMEQALRRGWNAERDGSFFGGISESHAKASAANARVHGWLPAREP
jgi:hypothetical protein